MSLYLQLFCEIECQKANISPNRVFGYPHDLLRETTVEPVYRKLLTEKNCKRLTSTYSI